MPQDLRRRQSSCVEMPLSLTTMRSGGIFWISRSDVFERRREVAQIAIVDADQLRLEPQRAVEFGLVMDLDEHVHGKIVRGGVNWLASSSETQAMMIRMQSAPVARAS